MTPSRGGQVILQARGSDQGAFDGGGVAVAGGEHHGPAGVSAHADFPEIERDSLDPDVVGHIGQDGDRHTGGRRGQGRVGNDRGHGVNGGGRHDVGETRLRHIGLDHGELVIIRLPREGGGVR